MKKRSQNYLELVPKRTEGLSFVTDEDNRVTLEVENRGFFNRLFQLILKKPKISYIHLDDLGSFIWTAVDGKRTVFEIAESVKEAFGEKAEPLYERIVKYFEILKSYRFVEF